jgi:hypothetical protein
LFFYFPFRLDFRGYLYLWMHVFLIFHKREAIILARRKPVLHDKPFTTYLK